MSRALFWLDKALSGGSEHGCRKCNKNIRIHVDTAYFIPPPTLQCHAVMTKRALAREVR